jgi:hypothetical protein
MPMITWSMLLPLVAAVVLAIGATMPAETTRAPGGIR